MLTAFTFYYNCFCCLYHCLWIVLIHCQSKKTQNNIFSGDTLPVFTTRVRKKWIPWKISWCHSKKIVVLITFVSIVKLSLVLIQFIIRVWRLRRKAFIEKYLVSTQRQLLFSIPSLLSMKSLISVQFTVKVWKLGAMIFLVTFLVAPLDQLLLSLPLLLSTNCH